MENGEDIDGLDIPDGCPFKVSIRSVGTKQGKTYKHSQRIITRVRERKWFDDIKDLYTQRCGHTSVPQTRHVHLFQDCVTTNFPHVMVS